MSGTLETTDRKELEQTLKALKLYRLIRKKLGKRAHGIFDARQTGVKTLRIEYASGMSQKDAESIMKQTFSDGYQDGFSVQWIENPGLIGGLRAFFDGELVDLTYLRAKRIISNTSL